MRGRPKPTLELTEAERDALQALTAGPESAQAAALRARIVLACAQGLENMAVAARLGVTNQTVSKWRGRFVKYGIDGLLDASRTGTPRTISDERVKAVVARTLEAVPGGAPHWSTRLMAREMGLTQNAVFRIRQAFGLHPHRQESSGLTNDPMFVEKVRDIVGLYVKPPLMAMALSVDEKSQAAAPPGAQPITPPARSQSERSAAQRVRRRAATMLAALDAAADKTDSETPRRQGWSEFLQFMRTIEAGVPNLLVIHLMMDDYGKRKGDAFTRWLAGRPRFHVHFTATRASWLKHVERWFVTLAERSARRSGQCSTRDLEQAIRTHLKRVSTAPAPFIWSQAAEQPAQ